MKRILLTAMAATLLFSCQSNKQPASSEVEISPVVVTDSMKSMYNHYAKWFADSEMKRFPEAWQLDHGKRLFFGYAQGVGCCAMLEMWKATGDTKYYDYVTEWADTIVFEDGNIHLYDMSTYNIDYINSGKVLFDVYKQTGNEKYRKAMDLLVKQMKQHPRTLEGGYWHKLRYPHQIWLDGLIWVRLSWLIMVRNSTNPNGLTRP